MLPLPSSTVPARIAIVCPEITPANQRPVRNERSTVQNLIFSPHWSCRAASACWMEKLGVSKV